MFRAQGKARAASLTGNISCAPTASPLPLSKLMDSQQADISVTQLWLLNRLWNLCLSHGLLRETSEQSELQYHYACEVGAMLLANCRLFSLPTMEIHGIGMIEKIYDVAIGIITAMAASTQITLDTASEISANASLLPTNHQPDGIETISAQEVLHALNRIIQNFRGGDHKYSSLFAAALNTILTHG